MPLDRLKEIGKALLVALLFHLPFSKLNLWFLLPVPFFLLIRERSFRFWLLTGFFAFFLSLHWIYIASYRYGSVSLPVSWLMVALLALVLALYQFGLSFLLWKLLGFRIWAFPLVWVLVELMRSFLPYGGFPWILVGSVLMEVPILKFLLSTVKVYGGSLVVLTGVVLTYTKHKKASLTLALAVGGLIYLSLWNYYSKVSPRKEKPFRVAIVQPAIPQDVKLSDEAFRRAYPLYLELIEEALRRGAQLIILPESAFPFFVSELGYEGKEILEISKRVPIVVGMVDVDFDERIAYNSVLAIKNYKIVDRYDKVRLLPFGEYIPQPFGFVKELFPAVSGIDYLPGRELKPLNLGSLKVATPVCFEVAYCRLVKELSANADLIAVLTNDAWFENSLGTYQHMRLARLRALENSKYILWVNNTGPSAVISPEGQILKATEYGKAQVLVYEVPLKR